MKPSTNTVSLIVTLAVVGGSIIASLFVLGPPTDERARRLDRRRVTDLQAIKAATDLYWTRHQRLPESLSELTEEPGVTLRVADPDDGEPYGYRTLDTLRYEVCARFQRESEQITRNPERALWSHGVGPRCFELDAEEIRGAER